MKQIKQVEIVNEENWSDLEKKIMKYVNEFQEGGFEVDIQYAGMIRDDIFYSALIIAYKTI